jgi:TRAP-type C4-dicarboxylate transport system substrate-binding protein
VALAAVLAGSAVGCGGSGQDKAGGAEKQRLVVLTLANMDTDPSNIDSPDFAVGVQRLSAGSIRLEVKSAWRSEDRLEHLEQGTIEDVRGGKVDLAVIPARAWDTVGVTSFNPLLAPFLVDSLELERRVLESPLAARMLEGVASVGLVGLAVIPGALRYPLGVSRPLGGPTDYEGMTIGVRVPTGIQAATLHALGAKTEVYRSGSIAHLDGAELDPVTINTNHYELQARALTANVVLWPRAMTIVMNRGAFDALSPRQREALREAGKEAIGPVFARIEPDQRGWLSSGCRAPGFSLVNASRAELAALRVAVQPIYDELERDTRTRELIAEIRKMREGVMSGPLECSARRSQIGTGASVLEGVWQRTLSAQDLLDVGASRAVAEADKGSYQLEFRHGRWTERRLDTGGTCSGTYVLDGDILRYSVDTARPAASNSCGPGFTGAVNWSLYRDTLTITAIPGRPAPLHAIAKPSTRIR